MRHAKVNYGLWSLFSQKAVRTGWRDYGKAVVIVKHCNSHRVSDHTE